MANDDAVVQINDVVGTIFCTGLTTIFVPWASIFFKKWTPNYPRQAISMVYEVRGKVFEGKGKVRGCLMIATVHVCVSLPLFYSAYPTMIDARRGLKDVGMVYAMKVKKGKVTE